MDENVYNLASTKIFAFMLSWSKSLCCIWGSDGTMLSGTKIKYEKGTDHIYLFRILQNVLDAIAFLQGSI